MKKDKTQKSGYLRFSHRIVFFLVRVLSFLYTRLFLGYRCRAKYKIEKGESVLVLSNHQTDFDPFCIIPCFSKPVYPMATDNIFAGKFRSKFFSYCGVIPKKKGASDARSAVAMAKYLMAGSSVLLFSEGNRYYAEFQYYMTPTMAKFIKNTKITVVLFNLHGGNGVSPRFKNKNRKGKFYGEIKRVLKYEDYSNMSDDELNAAIKDGIRVYDSDSGERYKSPLRAEYLERMLFACPVCGAFERLFSEGIHIKCKDCGLTVEYGEDLHLYSENKDFVFTRLIDWWNYQKRAVREMEIGDGVIFSDSSARLFLTDPFQKRLLLAEGGVGIDRKTLFCGERSFALADIERASVVSGRNLTFTADGHDYTLRGGERFNPLKYIFLLNKLETKMSLKKNDKYFALEE